MSATAGPDQGSAPGVLPITRGGRTVGVVLLGPDGGRWQSTTDTERVATVATLTGGAVVAIGLVAAAVRRPRVQRITMGPGGWVSFRGPSRPRPRNLHRPWWAWLLGARPLDR